MVLAHNIIEDDRPALGVERYVLNVN